MTLTKLTEKEIFGIQFYWMHMSGISYLENALESKDLRPYFLSLKDYRVVEIGPGNNPINKHYKRGEYIFAEGHFPKDGLSVLRNEKSSSAVVVSFGVIGDEILKRDYNKIIEDLTTRYINKLVKEIKRVMNPFGIIIGSDAKKYFWEPDIPSGVVHKFGGVYFRKDKN